MELQGGRSKGTASSNTTSNHDGKLDHLPVCGPLLDLCSTPARPLLDLCSTPARPLLDLCSTSVPARPLLDLCSTSARPARPLLDLCSTSAQPLLNLCRTPKSVFSVSSAKSDQQAQKQTGSCKLVRKRLFNSPALRRRQDLPYLDPTHRPQPPAHSPRPEIVANWSAAL